MNFEFYVSPNIYMHISYMNISEHDTYICMNTHTHTSQMVVEICPVSRAAVDKLVCVANLTHPLFLSIMFYWSTLTC